MEKGIEVHPEIYKEALSILRLWIGFDTVREIMQVFPKTSIYLAGGAIRDIVLRRQQGLKDLDFFISGEEDDAALTLMGKYGSLRQGPFGSPRWFPGNEGKMYCDVIPIKRFFNGLWQCEDIIDVLNQFDFTGNAIALDLRTGQFYDPQNGHRDLVRRTMRAIRFDYPDEPIAIGHALTRNAVLWFRILHYTAVLNFTIEKVTLDWLRKHCDFLNQVSDFSQTFFPLHPQALEKLSSFEKA